MSAYYFCEGPTMTSWVEKVDFLMTVDNLSNSNSDRNIHRKTSTQGPTWVGGGRRLSQPSLPKSSDSTLECLRFFQL